MHHHISRLGVLIGAIAGLLMAGTAPAAIGTASKFGYRAPASAAPAPAASVASSSAPAASKAQEEPNGSCSTCSGEWDCEKIQCTVRKIQEKTNCLLKEERCARKRSRAVYCAVVALNTELCKLSKCHCLSACEIERIITCIERKACDLQKAVECTRNSKWICIAREIKCQVEKLRECRKSCENGDTYPDA